MLSGKQLKDDDQLGLDKVYNENWKGILLIIPNNISKNWTSSIFFKKSLYLKTNQWEMK